ncbi:MAG: HAD family phosphatase [Chloroflexi bacterium]|nr:HAD family phosphatase [Chloroflexota bacterium]
MAAVKAFIFDFGGVIVRTEDPRPRHAWDERLGLPVGSVERAVHHSDIWIQAQLGRITPSVYWKGVAELLYMRGEDIDDLRRDYFSGDRLNYRVVDLIRDLRTAGYPVALLSNESIELETRMAQYGVQDLFDHCFISAYMGMMKPDPTAFRVALQTLHVLPHEAVFIDDSLPNIRAAQALSINAVLFRADTDLRTELAKYLRDERDHTE